MTTVEKMRPNAARPNLRNDCLTLCLDPGKSTYGIALFHGKRMIAIDTRTVKARADDGEQVLPYLLGCDARGWSILAADVSGVALPIGALIVEWPRIYAGGGDKDPNALLWLTACAGAIGAQFGFAPQYVFPSEWKGSVPKEVMTNRILKRFALPGNEAEWDLVVELENLRGKKAHHALDAAGMGLWAGGRL